MLKKVIIFIVLTLPFNLLAQTLTGKVFDNDKRAVALQKVIVKNLSNFALATTDFNGIFSIKAKKGDLISFTKQQYHTDTLFLIELLPKTIYLPYNVTILNEVAIIGAKISPYLDLKNPNAKPTTLLETSKERGGLRLNMGYGKNKRVRARILALAETDKYETEIRENFNLVILANLLPLKGEELNIFNILNKPSIQLIKTERPFDYTYYIVQTYNKWQKLPAAQKILPPLPKLKKY